VLKTQAGGIDEEMRVFQRRCILSLYWKTGRERVFQMERRSRGFKIKGKCKE
jgi:hypothetical protein